MSGQVRCHCQSCTIRGLMWPAILITAGILFLLGQLLGGPFEFGNTYPVILLVVGLLLLASSLVSREGHVDIASPPAPPAVPPGSTSQTPSSGQGQ